ncbi:MAG: hypothetical protein LBV60_03480 [Streptomyces sp.]|jgi:hypothetical protein|nr:hypothetical protein [Streptomyces sp.]
MGTWRRRCWWGLAVLGIGAVAGLVVWLTMAHPEGSAQAWGVVGGVAGVAATVVSLWQLRPAAASPAPATPPPPVTAENGGIAARGNVTRSSTRHIGTAPTTTPPAPGRQPNEGLVARNGGIAAGGDVEDSDTEYRP